MLSVSQKTYPLQRNVGWETKLRTHSQPVIAISWVVYATSLWSHRAPVSIQCWPACMVHGRIICHAMMVQDPRLGFKRKNEVAYAEWPTIPIFRTTRMTVCVLVPNENAKPCHSFECYSTAWGDTRLWSSYPSPVNGRALIVAVLVVGAASWFSSKTWWYRPIYQSASLFSETT